MSEAEVFEPVAALVGIQSEDKADNHYPDVGPIPFQFAKRYGVIVEALDAGGNASVLVTPDTPLQAIEELRRVLNRPLALSQVATEEFDSLLQRAYEGKSVHAEQAMEELGEELDLASVANAMPEPEDLLESEDDAPIIRLINAILSQAIKESASDIHIEPYEGRVVVRMRVDGMLREILRPKRIMGPLIASRIKVMAQLDISEKRLPQDGRIPLKIAGRGVDVRVSTMPSNHGERIVMRLLDKQAGRMDFAQLGMADESRTLMDELIHKPHGIILVTGPTGSGKTTTLYAGLSRLNESHRNIMTVEDPIEYDLDGVAQTQVNAKVDLSFATGLRAILRQDPDVVMVGEIRDLETAMIAVQASLTGHLVLSTLHTNSAVGAVTRLRDMGIEPFLLASSLIGVLSQRLVRRLCPSCRVQREVNERERDFLRVTQGTSIWHPVGCEDCQGRGYRGRTGIYELVLVNEELVELIHAGAGEQQLNRAARAVSPSILDDGRRRVLAGDTTIDELLRVTREA
ncbi:MAG: type II secretion system ATPase GspE [Gammaproteobacteria bacterium]